MGKTVVRLFLFNKRLFGKRSFLMLLCIVPLLIGAMRLGSAESGGIFQVAVYMRDPEEPLVAEIVEGLADKPGVLQYQFCETEEEAREMVADHTADMAWIFPEELTQELRRVAAEGVIRPVVTAVSREETIATLFCQEILCNTMFPFFSYAVYEKFIREDMGLKEISEAELREAYDRTLVSGSLFQMAYLDGQEVEEVNFLLAPLRGVMALWVVLCGLAASMYFMQDEQRGTFAKAAASRHLRLSFEAHGVLLFDAVVILLVGCGIAGVFTLWYRELLSAALFACCTVGFCNLIRLLCGTPERMGSCIPVLMMGMLILCPVFINISGWRPVQYLLPPYYYLKSIHSNLYMYGMLAYAVLSWGLCILVDGLRRRRENR